MKNIMLIISISEGYSHTLFLPFSGIYFSISKTKFRPEVFAVSVMTSEHYGFSL